MLRSPAKVSDDADPVLLRRWRDGDADAGRTLVTRHFDRVYGFCRRRAPDRAEDLTQQTFLAAQKRLDALRDSNSFRAFLIGVARFEVLRSRRDVARGLAARERLEAESDEPLASSPSRHVHVRQEQKLLLAALKTLAPQLQIVLELHYWEELTVAEIAEVVEAPEGTIKWRLSEARKQLRDALAAQPGPAQTIETTITNLDAWARSLRVVYDAAEA